MPRRCGIKQSTLQLEQRGQNFECSQNLRSVKSDSRNVQTIEFIYSFDIGLFVTKENYVGIFSAKKVHELLSNNRGRAVAQAVSRWLPTAAARVRVRAACGVCGGQSGTGAGLL
jgi:hypothetical protein